MGREVYRADADDRGVVLPGGANASHQHNSLIREVLQTIILTALVFFVVRLAVQPTLVSGPSMEPGLYTGDWVMVNKLAYTFGAPQRGDVIVFHPPSDPSELYVKRLIGLPGDTVTVTSSAVYVNNDKLSEPYIYPLTGSEVENPQAVPPLKLAPGQYFMMGDHRQDSNDSRVFGPVPKQNIVGKAQAVFWPVNKWEFVPTYPNVFSGVK